MEAAAALLDLDEVGSAVEISAAATSQLQALGAGERWRAFWIEARCGLRLDQPQNALAALARAQVVVDGIVSEFARGERARRRRLSQVWAALVDDHVAALEACADPVGAERLRHRWDTL